MRRGWLPLLLLFPALATAGIYRWTDADGQVHISDRPPPDSAVEQVEIRVNTYRAPPATPAAAPVVMYSAAWCGVCRKAKRYLQAQGIPFQERDIDASRENRRRFEALGGKGVPLILVGEEKMRGFSEARLETMLKAGGHRF